MIFKKAIVFTILFILNSLLFFYYFTNKDDSLESRIVVSVILGIIPIATIFIYPQKGANKSGENE